MTLIGGEGYDLFNHPPALIEYIFSSLFQEESYAMQSPVSLSTASRWFTYLSAVLYL